MIEKLTAYLNTMAFHASKLQKPIMWVGIAYLLCVVIMTVSIIIAWFVKWFYVDGTADIPLGMQILEKLIGPYMVAFVTFICGIFINPDGVKKENKINNEQTVPRLK